MKILIIASHPTQYHAPIFAEINKILSARGDSCLVAYLSDFSVREFNDREFGQVIVWDSYLISGYDYLFLNQSNAQPKNFWDLDVPKQKLDPLLEPKPDIAIVQGINYVGSFKLAIKLKFLGIRIFYRSETNDFALCRRFPRNVFRSLIYRLIYRFIFDYAIAIGKLNFDHYLAHGYRKEAIGLAHYSVLSSWNSITEDDKNDARLFIRKKYSISIDKYVIMFSGKLIPKKNPQVILEALNFIDQKILEKIAILFVGSGELLPKLQDLAYDFQFTDIFFTGFINQSQLPSYYFAADVLILPSRQMGETWGLVVNEALHAGLPCIVSKYVGCGPDFVHFPDFQIVGDEEPSSYAEAVSNVYGKERNFDKYCHLMEDFTISSTARRIIDFISDKYCR